MSLDPLTAALDLGTSLINKIWPDPAQQSAEARKLVELYQKGDLAEMQAYVGILQGQMEVNKEEAKHPSIFVAGWRPFVGWVCGISLLYVGMIEPLARFIARMVGYIGEFPVIDATLTMPILLGMLGIGAQRSWDKIKGVGTSSTSK